MANIFEIGTEVSGDSMIGYEYHLNYIMDTIVNTNTNLSITGIKRSGKTSLVKEAVRRAEKENDNIIFLIIDLAKYNSFFDFLRKLVQTTERSIRRAQDLKENDDIQDILSDIKETNPEDFLYSEYIGDLFQTICDEGFKIVLIIDEFDEAANLFRDTPDFELLRNWASDSNMRVSLLLVSRRQVYMIEKRNFNNSTFHGIVSSYPINGFNTDDILCFVQVMSDNGVVLEDDQLSRIWYYAGRSPYVWSCFGYYMIEAYQQTGEQGIDVDQLFRDKLVIDLTDHFDAIYKNLSTDSITTNDNVNEMNSVDKLNAYIFGPKLGITNDDIDVMRNLGYLDSKDSDYSISPYFTDLLAERYSPCKNSVFEAIINVEKKLKVLINKNILGLVDFFEAYGDSITEIQRYILGHTIEIDEGAIRRYEGFISNNKKVFNKETTFFDVMSLKDSAKIISECWETLFKKYFNFDDLDKWKKMFEQCGIARNPVAHGSEELLADEDKKIIDVYCKRINDQLSESNLKSIEDGQISDDELLAYVIKYNKNTSNEVIVNEGVAIEKGIFIGSSSGTTKNLKGKLSTGENGSIRNEFFSCINKSPADFYGKEIPVIVVGPNIQNNGYILEPAIDLANLL